MLLVFHINRFICDVVMTSLFMFCCFFLQRDTILRQREWINYYNMPRMWHKRQRSCDQIFWNSNTVAIYYRNLVNWTGFLTSRSTTRILWDGTQEGGVPVSLFLLSLASETTCYVSGINFIVWQTHSLSLFAWMANQDVFKLVKFPCGLALVWNTLQFNLFPDWVLSH